MLPLPPLAILQTLRSVCRGDPGNIVGAFAPDAQAECNFDPALAALTTFKVRIVANNRRDIGRLLAALHFQLPLRSLRTTWESRCGNTLHTVHDWRAFARDFALDVSGRSSCIWQLDPSFTQIEVVTVASKVITPIPSLARH